MAYIDRLRAHLQYILSSLMPESYDDIFKHSEGAFPSLVFSLLSSADENLGIGTGLQRNSMITDDSLPEPSPVNFDWRFDNQSVTNMIGLVKSENFSRIALFGTPSLFIPLTELGFDVWLFDLNITLLDKIQSSKIVIGDLNILDVEKFGDFDCLVMDPPWYLDYYTNWISTASVLVRDGGKIFCTLFEQLLRPAAKREIGKILKLSRSVGDIQVLENFLTYQTPEFERNLFRETGIPCYSNWRNADLLVINKYTSLKNPKRQFESDRWNRLMFGSRVVGIKIGGGNEKITLKYPYPNKDARIKSVSNRDRVRKKMNLIVSNNIGLIVTGNDRLYRALLLFNKGIALETVAINLQLSPKETNIVEEIINAINNKNE